jgi:hypothetical protein
MNREQGLNALELASLDLLISIAQARGRGFDDRLESVTEQTEALVEVHEAMWEARHGGLELSERDRETIVRIGELAASLEIAPTLGQLIEMRGEALRLQVQG